MNLTVTTVIFLTSVVLFCIFIIKKKGRSNIPGPRGYPIVGNLFDLVLNKLYLKFFKWSKIYGDIFQIQLFGQVFVIVNSSEMIRELFLKEPNATFTSARPETFLKNYMVPDVAVAFTSYDKDWVKRRKLMRRFVHAQGERGITDKLSAYQKDLPELNQVCDPSGLVEDFVLCFLQILVVGQYEERGSELSRNTVDIDDAGDSLSSPGLTYIYNKFPFLRYLPLPPSNDYWRYLSIQQKLFTTLEDQSDKAGIYQEMKTLVNTKESEDVSGSWLTKTIMEAMLHEIMGAALGITRGALLSAIQIMMSLQHVQTKLQEEVDRVVGHDRQPTLSDKSQMPYTEAVVLETLRYTCTSVTPFSLMHLMSQDVVTQEFTIPKGAHLIANIWTMHHSEKEWKNPFKFEPERFLDDSGDLLPADHERRKQFMAFGVGKRSCVGEVFAKSKIFLLLATIMQVYTVLPPDGESPTLFDPRDTVKGSIKHPKSYRCKFVKRQLVH